MKKLLVFLLALTFGLTVGAPARAEAPPTLSALFLKKLNDAQDALAEKHQENSRAILKALTEQVSNTPYENGLAWNMLGYLHYQNGDLKLSAQAYEKALQFDIPDQLAQDTRKTLGQVYAADGNCARAAT